MFRTIFGAKQVNSGKNWEKHKCKQTVACHVLACLAMKFMYDFKKYFVPIMYSNNALKKNDAAWNNIYYNIAIVLLSLLLLHK